MLHVSVMGILKKKKKKKNRRRLRGRKLYRCAFRRAGRVTVNGGLALKWDDQLCSSLSLPPRDFTSSGPWLRVVFKPLPLSPKPTGRSMPKTGPEFCTHSFLHGSVFPREVAAREQPQQPPRSSPCPLFPPPPPLRPTPRAHAPCGRAWWCSPRRCSGTEPRRWCWGRRAPLGPGRPPGETGSLRDSLVPAEGVWGRVRSGAFPEQSPPHLPATPPAARRRRHGDTYRRLAEALRTPAPPLRERGRRGQPKGGGGLGAPG